MARTVLGQKARPPPTPPRRRGAPGVPRYSFTPATCLLVPQAQRRLKIAYMSPDLFHHSVSFFAHALLELGGSTKEGGLTTRDGQIFAAACILYFVVWTVIPVVMLYIVVLCGGW